MMERTTFFACWAVATACCWTLSVEATEDKDDLLFVDTRVGEETIRLAVDTGSGPNALISNAFKKLGLQVASANDGELKLFGDKVNVAAVPLLKLVGATIRDIRFALIDNPPNGLAHFDGIIGWQQLQAFVFEIDWEHHSVIFLKQRPDVGDWISRRLQPGADVAILKGEDPNIGVYLDTGSQFDCDLNVDQWQSWMNKHPSAMYTLVGSWTPGAGVSVCKQSFDRDIELGGIRFKDLMVKECEKIYLKRPAVQAVLGLGALRQYKIVVDGPAHQMYFKKRDIEHSNLRYNHIAAVFAPTNDSDDLIAHVLENGPAYRAGVRDGDILISVNDVIVKDWRNTPSVMPLDKFFDHESETPIKIGVTRNGMQYAFDVESKNLFRNDRQHK